MKQPDIYLTPTGNERTISVKNKKDLVIYEEKKGIDLRLLRKRSNSKTFSGFLLGKMKEASKEGNLEMVKSLEFIYNEYKKYSESERLMLENWKGKSSFSIIEHPDYFEVITYQKKDKHSEPKEIKRIINKKEVNDVLVNIYKLNKDKPIKTREIAEAVYKEKWKDVFSNRFEHTNLNLILRLLDKKGIISYGNGGLTRVLK
jgi:hypothetical protein